MHKIVYRHFTNSHLLARSPTFSFASLEEKKQIDYGKLSIQLMIKPISITADIDYLKKSYQYDVGQALKLYIFKEENLSIGEVISILLDNNLRNFELKNGFTKFLNCIEKAYNIKQGSFDQHELHVQNNLQNMLSLAQSIEKHTTTHFSKIILAFLTNYIQKYEELPKHKLYKITTYLTNRCYVSSNLLRHFKKLTFDKDVVENTIKIGSSAEIKQLFETISGMLQTILNLEKWQSRGYLKSENIGENMKKQELTQAFFKMLLNPYVLPLVLSVSNPHEIFIRDIFPTHKNQYYSIIKSILNPKILSTIRMNQNLIPLLFDYLLIYTDQSQKAEVINILQLYTKSVANFENDGNDQIWGGYSLIFLCDKYNYFSYALYNFIIANFFKNQALVDQHSIPFSAKRNKIRLKNTYMTKCYELGTILKNISGKNIPIQSQVIYLFNKKFEYALEMSRNQEATGVQSYIFQGDLEQIRKLKMQQNFLTHYQLFDEFYTKQNVENLLEKAKKVQTELKITYKQEVLEDHTYPTNLRLSIGARLKTFIWNVYFYSFNAKNIRHFQNIYKFINENASLTKMIERQISYPGLLEGVILLYDSVHTRKLLEQTIPNQSSPSNLIYNQVSKTQNESPFGELYKKYKYLMSREYQNLLVSSELREQQKITVQFEFNRFIQMLHYPPKVRPEIYKNEKNLAQVLAAQYLSERSNKNSNLKYKLMEELRTLRTDASMQSHLKTFACSVLYPFVADFFLIYRSHRILVIFVEPEEKKILEAIEESDQQQKQRQKEESNGGQNKKARSKSLFNANFLEQCLRYFKNEHNIILISNEDEVKNLRNLLMMVDRKK